MCEAKVRNYRRNKAFGDSDCHFKWPTVADTVIEARRTSTSSWPKYSEAVIWGISRWFSIQQYCGQNSGSRLGDGAVVTKLFVVGAGFFQTMPLG